MMLIRRLWSCIFFFFKQKTAYEMRISDWSSDVCSSDLDALVLAKNDIEHRATRGHAAAARQYNERTAFMCNLEPRATTLEFQFAPALVEEIGRASCRERVCQSV